MSHTRTLSRSLVLLAIALPLVSAAGRAQQPSKMPAPLPVKPATLPSFQEATLPNGLRILLVESRRQPVVSLVLMFPAGDSHDPAGKEGLATLAASTITKGAGSRTADQISSAIEGVGGSINAESGLDFLNVRANVLAENAPLAFELLGDAVVRPTFFSKEVELARTQTLSALQLDRSSPGSLAQRFFAATMWGAHPYARRASPTSVRSLTVDDLRTLQRTRLVPRGALLVVAGNITLATVRQLAQQNLGTWSGSAPAGTRRPAPPARERTEILLVHRPGSVQSNILVGNLTVPPASASVYPMTVASRVLGGGSDGRLFKTLREKRGWTYGGYSTLSNYKDMGSITASVEVRNPVTDSALTELLSIERSFATTPVAAVELTAAKEGLVGSLPLQLETAQGIAEQVGRYTMLGLPSDYIRTLRPRLATVDASQLQAAARQFIRPDQALIVVVGDGAQVYEKLARVAPTRIVSVDGDPMQPSDLTPRTTSLPVELTKLVEHADSFAVNVQGQAMGWQTSSLSRTPSGFAYRTALQLGPMMQQKQETTFGSDLTPQGVNGSGRMMGTAVNTDLTYKGGRVKGSTVKPGPAGVENVAVDTTVAPGVLDDNMIGALVPALPWTPTAKFTVSAFDAASGTTRPVTLAVAGTESVTVPAGTFSVYRVNVTGQAQPLTLFVTTAAPNRVVKMAPAGAPIEFVLVK